ncbi:hypothetical protein ISN44_As08g035660 [Arabidopsis suecica]|uniref:Uncharacterized protein n=1 Tax=Arabidopsis suecica TaxID=45249 RepID=A0A8T2BG03_ARASU|nr:hypothetical protein ISN44_As08g035660 [Arabidopsis suecica]
MEQFRVGELRHMLTTVFLSAFAESLLRPVMTDVTVAAVCSSENALCSLAVYLTGVQQVAACLSVAWSPWVPYATTVLVPGSKFVMPSVCGIASREVGSSEQGKVQGCISGVHAFAEVVAPLVYSPLTDDRIPLESSDKRSSFFVAACLSGSWSAGVSLLKERKVSVTLVRVALTTRVRILWLRTCLWCRQLVSVFRGQLGGSGVRSLVVRLLGWDLTLFNQAEPCCREFEFTGRLVTGQAGR